MKTFTEAYLSIDEMLFDPNNYRFQNASDFVFADPKRFAEDSVQQKAFERLRNEALLPLKQSILKNGFLPFERLVVAKYDASRYLVIEGNRRLAALKWIGNDAKAGASIPEEVQNTLGSVPVVVVPSDDPEDPALREALMGVRHVSGIREWGGYQRAQLVAVLKDNYSLDSQEVAQRLGMSVNEVNRRYRALRALKQMMESDSYSDVARPEMYPIFHEAVSLPAVRTWLGWNDTSNQFENEDDVNQFYDLITPGEDGEAKITSFSQVRELRSILDNSEAKKVLLDPTRSFTEALAITKRQDIINSWKSEIAEAIEAMRGIGALELKKAAESDLLLLQAVRDTADELIKDAAKLKSI